ncbi:MAG: dihydroneopterin aldolase family protein [Candidatus Hermodarchaeota archaeon]
MKNSKDKIYFSPDLSDRERACFETGIKLGALYHILCGIPISTNENVIKSIEQGIEAALSCQPYVKSINITLDRNKIVGDKSTQFDYDEITGKIIRAEIVLEYETIEISAKIDWVETLQYPLMYIEKIQESE